MHEIELTIKPNAKYWRIVDPVHRIDSSEGGGTIDYEDWPDDHKQAAEAYVETVENAPEPEDAGEDPDDLATLSWDDFSVASDPDLVAKMATYFDGIAPDEPTERIRAKLRLLDCEVYANAQIAAQAELDGTVASVTP